MLHGTGILLHAEDDSPPAIGFYTSRAVKAESAEEAVEKAKRSVLAVWASDRYITANKGGMPVLTTENVARISFWQSLKIPNKGHSFYARE
jgi:hypothetical protein